MHNKERDRLLNMSEAARFLGLHVITVQKHARAGKLPFSIVKIGDRPYVQLSVLQAFMSGEQARPNG
jgi:BioD-like phosphotransacetylase family protein